MWRNRISCKGIRSHHQQLTAQAPSGRPNEVRASTARASRDYRDNVIETLARRETAALRQLVVAEDQRDTYREMVRLLLAQAYADSKQLDRLRDRHHQLTQELRHLPVAPVRKRKEPA